MGLLLSITSRDEIPRIRFLYRGLTLLSFSLVPLGTFNMSLITSSKAEVINKHRINEQDTASPQVQIALLTRRLLYLNEHFKKNKKDHHSRRGLMRIVGQRRRLLDYLHKHDALGYKKLIAELGIRK